MNHRNRLECVRVLSFAFPFRAPSLPLMSAGALALLAAAPALAQEATTRNERLTLSPLSSSSGQLFGSAVAADSGLAAFGAPGALSGEGTVTVFERGSSNTWPLTATLEGSDTGASDAFGSAVALDGSVIVVGAPLAGGAASGDQGAVYVFRKSGSSWSQVAKLVASDGAGGDGFGSAVAMKGDIVVIGAPGADISGAAERGAAYVFRNTSGNTWTQAAKVTASNGAAGDRFGASVAAQSSRALIGAPSRSAGAGGAYIFRSTGGSWVEAVALTAGESGTIGFGSAVALSGTLLGDWAFVGAPDAVNSGLGSGAAFVYQRVTDTNWPSAARLSSSDGGSGDDFGASIAAADDRVVVGSPLDTVRAISGAGSARMFRRMASGTWQEGSKLAATSGSIGGGFADAVAIAGERVMVGAPTTGGRGQGYHYKLDYVRAGIDDNGRSDVLWFAPGSGNIAAWGMNGLVRETGGIVSNTLSGSHEYDGAGDFYGDGRSAMLFRNRTTGAFRMWRLSGLSVVDDRAVSGGIGFEWQYLATGDISGDGKADVILRNSLSGQVNGWIMSGSSKTSGGTIGNSLGLDYMGLADIDGDGRSDLLWRTELGAMRAWLMNGLVLTSDTAFGGASAVTAEWRVAATGDFDGDGDDDLMWRNTSTGAVSGWLVAGASVQSTAVVHPGIALNWRIESAGDLNADGKDDILWRNMSNGDVNGWLMDGLVKSSGSFVKNVGLSWSMLNDDDYNDDHGGDGNGNDDNRDDSYEGDDDHGGNGGGGNGGGGNGGGLETTTGAAFNAAVNAALASSALPILEAEVEYEAGTTFVAVLQWRASDSSFVRVAVNAATGAVIGTTAWTPTTVQLEKYADALAVYTLVTVPATTAVSQVLAANPGALPHAVELDSQAGSPKWEVEIVTSSGSAVKVRVAAR